MGEHEDVYRPVIPASVRTWLYGVLTAAIPLLTAYGFISEQNAPLWVALGGALFGTATAFAYRPTRETGGE